MQNNEYDAIILAVAHDEFKQMTVAEIHALGKTNYVLYDLKTRLWSLLDISLYSKYTKPFIFNQNDHNVLDKLGLVEN